MLIFSYKGSLLYTLFFSFIACHSYIIMSFCKKGLHTFLAITNLSDINSPSPPPHKCHPGSLGIGLVSATGDTCRPPNVLESATVGAPPLQPPSPYHSVFGDGYSLRKETDGIPTVGFFEEVGEVVDGLMSCTESLGFESSDERRVDEGVRDVGNDGAGDSDLESCLLSRAKRREENERMRDRKFPPPITSLNDKGRPNFYLRALRRDGRLELSEVRIDRPEILRASRADGRLRLEFVKEQEELAVDADDDAIEITEEDEEEVEETTTSESEEDVRSEEWKVLVSGEGFGRCHSAIGHGNRHPHHHNLHMWRQHCVTIR